MDYICSHTTIGGVAATFGDRPGPHSRVERIADAAIAVIAEGGMRALTHRAVDQRSRLPAGSTSNLFRTRGELIVGVIRRVAELDTADLHTLTLDLAAVLDLMDRWTHQHPERLRARLELTLEALRNPQVNDILHAARAELVATIDHARHTAPVGAPQVPGLTSAQIVALLSGLQWAEATTGQTLTGEVLARLVE